MPPYGLYSLANTPEELLNRGYGYSADIPMNQLSDAEENLLYTKYDPAFGNLNTDFGYFSTPFTGAQPFQNASFLTGERNNDLGFTGDLDNPSFGGVSGYRDTGGVMGIDPSINQRKNLGFDTSYGVANEPDEEETEQYETDKFGYRKQSNNKFGGIMDLIGSLVMPGYGFFKGIAKGGLEGLQGFGRRLGQSDFAQSRTGAEYFMKRRERKQAERAQEAMSDVYRSARDEGFTNDRGGFSTNRADRAGTSVGSGQFSPETSRGRSGY